MQYRPELLRESDRYRGRRRAPTPPRSRYAAVVTTAFVGAGVVAIGAGFGIDDAKVSTIAMDPATFADVSDAREAAEERASRGDRPLSYSITEAPDTWVLPAYNYSVTSVYGQRWGRLHQGVDLALPEGTPVAAMHGGIIVFAGWSGGYGNMVMIDHGNGVKTLYGHNSALKKKVGDKVAAGDIIALVGSTGFSTGAHIHLEVHVNGVAQDPVSWFKKRGVDLKMEIETLAGDVVR